jgi:hypothetical protein
MKTYNVIRKIPLMAVMAAFMMVGIQPAQADIDEYRNDIDYSQYIRFDRYLDVEVWTDDDEYYEGEEISIQFRANKDCYAVVYNIDTRGNVSLLYPSDQYDDIKIERDRTYRIPDSYDDYELTVSGPEGVEYIQIVASLTPLPIPDWYGGSELVCYEDPIDFMDYINAEYFGDRETRLALDMTIFRVNEWHDAYFRPVYVHDYPYCSWNTCGTVYFDYPWGASIYIDGIYWGCAPLFIPRIYYGWHWVTIYDRYGYCWEDRLNVYKRKTVIIDESIVKTRSNVKSRYRDVRRKAYLDPVKNGYPDYNRKIESKRKALTTLKAERSRTGGVSKTRDTYNVTKNRGDSKGSSAKRRGNSYENHKRTGDRGNSGLKSNTGKRTTTKSRSSGNSSVKKRAKTQKAEGKKSAVGKKSSSSKKKSSVKPDKIKSSKKSSSSKSSSSASSKKKSSSNSSGSKSRSSGSSDNKGGGKKRRN